VHPHGSPPCLCATRTRPRPLRGRTGSSTPQKGSCFPSTVDELSTHRCCAVGPLSFLSATLGRADCLARGTHLLASLRVQYLHHHPAGGHERRFVPQKGPPPSTRPARLTPTTWEGRCTRLIRPLWFDPPGHDSHDPRGTRDHARAFFFFAFPNHLVPGEGARRAADPSLLTWPPAHRRRCRRPAAAPTSPTAAARVPAPPRAGTSGRSNSNSTGG
jgi:hypothetical protein